MRRVQLSVGRGPEEVVDFLAELVDAFAAWIHAEGGAVELHWGPGRRSVVADVSGVPLSGWLGTHALIDPVRGRRRRRRWFVDVRLLGEEAPIGPFDPAAIRFHTARAGGPGGQHVNTTASAVRAVYLPTGWDVRVASERSQHRNRAEAVRRLRARHAEADSQQRAARAHRGWRAHVGLVRGNPVQSWRRRRAGLVPAPHDDSGTALPLIETPSAEAGPNHSSSSPRSPHPRKA